MESTVNNDSAESESQEESKFAGVVFHNVQDLYVPGKDIRCCYSIKPWVSTTANDWIGLYKVGWQAPKDYLCYEYSPVVDNSAELSSSSSLTRSLSTQNSVVFRGGKLPSEECEFYQFCYVTSSGEIRGASYPFQISYSKPGDLEICSEEDDDGLLVVNNRTTLLENSLAKAYDENAALKDSKEKVESDCLKFQDMVLVLEAKKTELVSVNEKQKKMLDKATSEKTEFEELYKETFEQLKSSQTGLKLANEKTAEVQQQLESERAKHLKNSSEQEKFEEERVHLMDVISHKDKTIQSFLETVEENSSKMSVLKSEIQKMENEKEALQESYDNLAEWKAKGDESLKKSEQAYAALEKSQAEQFEQVYKLQAENTKMKERLSIVQLDMEKMSDSFSHQQTSMEEKHLKERLELEKQIEVMAQQWEENKVELVATKEKLEAVVSESQEQQMIYEELAQRYEESISKVEEQLAQERAFNNSLSCASDRQVAELQEQLNAQLEKNASALKQTEEQSQVIQRLEENAKASEKEIEKMQNEIQQQAQQLELVNKKESEVSLQSDAANTGNGEKTASFEGSYFALKTAHEQLRKQYLQAKKDMENLWRQKADLKRQLATVQTELPDSDLRFQLSNLKKQIEDLRIRLNMGAEAYKAKFKECQKYEKQLKKIQKGSSGESTPQSPSSVAEFEIRSLKQSLEDEKTAFAALKKSLENYKVEASQAKQELSKVSSFNNSKNGRCVARLEIMKKIRHSLSRNMLIYKLSATSLQAGLVAQSL